MQSLSQLLNSDPVMWKQHTINKWELSRGILLRAASLQMLSRPNNVQTTSREWFIFLPNIHPTDIGWVFELEDLSLWPWGSRIWMKVFWESDYNQNALKTISRKKWFSIDYICWVPYIYMVNICINTIETLYLVLNFLCVPAPNNKSVIHFDHA
jgi:hypothetical protein